MIIRCVNCGKEFESEVFGDGLCSDDCRESTQVKISQEEYRKRFDASDKKTPPAVEKNYGGKISWLKRCSKSSR